MMPLTLVGRAGELAELGAAWRRLAERPRSGARVALVGGGAGSGKSRLVRAALEDLAPVPSAVLFGRARLGAPEPYDWLASALPGGDDPAGLPLRRAVGVVRGIVGTGPAVLVVEDLHALDAASLELVTELATVPGLPALVLVTSRPPDEAPGPGPAAGVLARLAATPDAVRLYLDALGPAPVAELLAQIYPDPPVDAVHALHERTGGDPYWLTELLAAAAGRTVTELAKGALPDPVRRLVLARLSGAPEPVWRLAWWLASGGRPGPDPAGGDRRDGLSPDTVAHLTALGLLRVAGDRVVLHPPLVAEALTAGPAPGPLPLDRPGGYPRPGDADRGPEPATLRAAREHLAAGLPDAALTAVEIGLAGADDPLPLLRIGVTAAGAEDRWADAAAYARRWLHLAAPDDPLDRAAAHRELAIAYGRLGYLDRCAEELAAAERALPDGAGPVDAASSMDTPDSGEGFVADAVLEGRARLLAATAEAHLLAGRLGEAAATARTALAHRGRDAPTEGSSMITLAAALSALAPDDPEPGMDLLRTARRAAAERRDLATLGRAVECLLSCYLPRLDEAPAWQVFDEVAAVTARFGLERETGGVIAAGVRLAIRVGNAARALELSTARLPLEPDRGRRAVLSATAGLLALEQDDAGQAGRFADRADADAAGAGEPAALASAALLRVALGNPLSEYLRHVPAGHDRAAPDSLAQAARIALAAGEPARRIRQAIAARWPGLGSGRERSRVGAQLRCALLAADGERAGAVAAGRAGLDGQAHAAYLDADTHLIVGRCLAALGRTGEARQHGDRAAALLARWPGRRTAQVDEFLAELGGAAVELTAREIEVLSCLAVGMSNKQVARSLGISIRTVTVHVSNLLRKTRSASRTEAALWAVRHRHAEPPTNT